MSDTPSGFGGRRGPNCMGNGAKRAPELSNVPLAIPPLPFESAGPSEKAACATGRPRETRAAPQGSMAAPAASRGAAVELVLQST